MYLFKSWDKLILVQLIFRAETQHRQGVLCSPWAGACSSSGSAHSRSTSGTAAAGGHHGELSPLPGPLLGSPSCTPAPGIIKTQQKDKWLWDNKTLPSNQQRWWAQPGGASQGDFLLMCLPAHHWGGGSPKNKQGKQKMEKHSARKSRDLLSFI